MRYHDFGSDFFFGTATASYQVEGGLFQGKRASSIWDDFSATPGKVYMNENGNVACDHWNRYEEDILLMKELGFSSYRFSIAWPRIFPEDGGVVNMEAIEHYRKVCDFLHENGMTACATIYHWDLPSYLEEKGGWAWRGICREFQRYAEALYEGLGDAVDRWITLNEPFCIAYLGYLYGVHAPGRTDLDDALRAVHHLNLAHGLAVESYRKTGLKAPIGITWNLNPGRAADNRPETIRANEIYRAFNSEVFTSPVFEGKYPEILEKELGLTFPVEEGDMETIASPIDFVGINFYNQPPVMADPTSRLGFKDAPFWEDTTDMGWPITPFELLKLLRWVASLSKGLPIYITENGCACRDEVTPDHRVHDRDRIAFLQSYLEMAEEAVKEGIPLKGYYVWSFMDNYEWAFGYSKRFGIVYTDYATLERIPKDSAYFMRDINAGYRYW